MNTSQLLEVQEQDQNQILENINEFCTIIQFLSDSDLAVLHQVLMLDTENEAVYHQRLRHMRSLVTDYPTLYNAYTARVLVNNPNHYIAIEIVIRYKKQFLVKRT